MGHTPRHLPTTFIALLCAAPLALAACGSAGGAVAFKKGGPPAPARCIEQYNGDIAATEFGKHAYTTGHDSRSAHVFIANKPQYGVKNQCVVVYAARESDREFGTLGQFSLGSGWTLITDFPVTSEQERIALQRSGAQQANAALRKDGTLGAFQ